MHVSSVVQEQVVAHLLRLASLSQGLELPMCVTLMRTNPYLKVFPEQRFTLESSQWLQNISAPDRHTYAHADSDTENGLGR